MEAFEVLQKAIPENASTKVGKFLSVSGSLVSRWRRRPPEDEDPNATGQRSILDRICELIDVCFLINPAGVGLIVEYINNHFRNLMSTHAQPIDCRDMQLVESKRLLKEAVEAVTSIDIEGCTPDTLRELVELRDKADEIIQSVQQTMSQEDQTHD